MDTQTAVALIETYSSKMNDQHYGITAAAPHYYGGSQHNDDRLTATVEGAMVVVSDGNDYQALNPLEYTSDELRAWVYEYMMRGWE